MLLKRARARTEPANFIFSFPFFSFLFFSFLFFSFYFSFFSFLKGKEILFTVRTVRGLTGCLGVGGEENDACRVVVPVEHSTRL